MPWKRCWDMYQLHLRIERERERERKRQIDLARTKGRR